MPAGQAVPSGDDGGYLDDDALADAIAASYLPSGLIPVITPEVAAAYARGEDFAAAVGSPAAPDVVPATAPVDEPAQPEVASETPDPAPASDGRSGVSWPSWASEPAVAAGEASEAASAADPPEEATAPPASPLAAFWDLDAAEAAPSTWAVPPAPPVEAAAVPISTEREAAPAEPAPDLGEAAQRPLDDAEQPVPRVDDASHASAPDGSGQVAGEPWFRSTPAEASEAVTPEAVAPEAVAPEAAAPETPPLQVEPRLGLPPELAFAPPPDPSMAAGGADAPPPPGFETEAVSEAPDAASTPPHPALADSTPEAAPGTPSATEPVGGSPLAQPALVIEPVEITAPVAQPTDEELREALASAPFTIRQDVTSADAATAASAPPPPLVEPGPYGTPAAPPVEAAPWSGAPPPPPPLVEPEEPALPQSAPAGATISGDEILDEPRPLAPTTGSFDFSALLAQAEPPSAAAAAAEPAAAPPSAAAVSSSAAALADPRELPAPVGPAAPDMPPPSATASRLAEMPPPVPTSDAGPGADADIASRATDSDYRDEDDDSVDPSDRAAVPVDGVAAAAAAAAAPPPTAPMEPPLLPVPVATTPTGEHRSPLVEPSNPPAHRVESTGVQPTALEQRAGRSVRMLWIWFAANASVVSLALGAVVLGLGLSISQAIIAILAGVALSTIPLILSTVAGRATGQPTLVVSRASFGIVGNAVPALVAVLARAFWGGALLWLAASSVPEVLETAGLVSTTEAVLWGYAALGGAALVVILVAVMGFGLLSKVQLVLSVLSLVLVAGIIALTAGRIDLAAAVRTPYGDWTLVLGGAVLVFSVLGIAWAHTGGDVARYQRPATGSGGTSAFTGLGVAIPSLALIVWGALLAASDAQLAAGLASAPLTALAGLLPSWYPVPLLAAAILGLLAAAILSVYSGGFALQALGLGAHRAVTTAIAGLLAAAVAGALLLLQLDAVLIVRDAATTTAVPVAAWIGILGSELAIRRRLHAPSLAARGGVYPAIRIGNLLGLLLAAGVGFGLTTSTVTGLGWQGYLLSAVGIPLDSALGASDVGVLAAFVLGLLIPLVVAIPVIRKQEAAHA